MQGDAPTDLPPGQRVTVEQPSGGQVVVNVSQQAGSTPSTKARRRERGAVNMRDRRRRLARIAYYTQAATNGIPFTRAYQQALTKIGKGNSNEMHAVYQTAKAKRGNIPS